MPDRNDNAEALLAKYGIHYPRCGAWFGPGWTHIVEKLIEDLIAAGWDKQLEQVKEKYGTLRFYVGSASDEMYELIRKAEGASARTCEECGAEGNNRAWYANWYITLCQPCGKKHIAKCKAEDAKYE